MVQYRLAIILSLITLVGIIVTYDFDSTFAFHKPNSGYTIIDGQLYANNGTDNRLDRIFIQSGNNTPITFANASTIQRSSGAASDGNFPVQQSMNGTQNFTSSSSSSDVISHLNLAKQAVEVGDPDIIIKELGLIEQQLLPLVANSNNTSAAFSTMSNYSSTDLKELDKEENKPSDEDEFTTEEEQLPQSSASQRDPPQRTRNYE